MNDLAPVNGKAQVKMHELSGRLKQLALALPKHLLKPMSLMPTHLSEPLMSFTLNQIFKTALAEQELEFLEDNWLHLVITDANFQCFISVQANENKLIVNEKLPNNVVSADVKFSADTHSLALLASKQVDPDTLFFKRQLLVTGNTELGLAIKNFLDDFDFKEGLPALLARFATLVENKFSIRSR